MVGSAYGAAYPFLWLVNSRFRIVGLIQPGIRRPLVPQALDYRPCPKRQKAQGETPWAFA